MVWPVLISIMFTVEPSKQNRYSPQLLTHMLPPLNWVSLSLSTARLEDLKQGIRLS